MAASERSLAAGGTPGLRAVLLDAGNTLIHMPRTREEILRDVCARLGASITLEEAAAASLESERYYVERYLGYTGDQGEFWIRYHGEALRHLGIEDPGGGKAAFLSHEFGRAGVWEAYPEAAGACSSLRSLGLKLGVVSNGPTTVADLLSQAALLPFFDVVVCSQAAGFEKPDPRIFDVALQSLGVGPRDALFVGDIYEVDVLGARAAGLLGILIDRQGDQVDRPCAVIRGLDELLPLVSGAGRTETGWTG